MNGRGAAGDAVAARMYRLLLNSYPPSFRNEFGPELHQTFWECYQGRAPGLGGFISFWVAVLVDLARSAPRQWASSVYDAGSSRSLSSEAAPPYLLATLAGAVVFTLYAVTLAPTIGFWDSGEYTARAAAGSSRPLGRRCGGEHSGAVCLRALCRGSGGGAFG